ncbi:hypothetical protein [Sphingomonas melonis]|uniref:hypothetical protein n=1 Tax=Sphingomonas melonis TaxID=152682 RepID=UPI0035C7AFB1
MTTPDLLDAQARVLRNMAAGVMASGRPVDVPWPHGGRKPLHQLTSLDILDEAEAFEADAAKLRTLYRH